MSVARRTFRLSAATALGSSSEWVQELYGPPRQIESESEYHMHDDALQASGTEGQREKISAEKDNLLPPDIVKPSFERAGEPGFDKKPIPLR